MAMESDGCTESPELFPCQYMIVKERVRQRLAAIRFHGHSGAAADFLLLGPSRIRVRQDGLLC